MNQEIRHWIKSLELSLTRDEYDRKLIIQQVIKEMKNETMPLTWGAK